jgi:hypothetical protein
MAQTRGLLPASGDNVKKKLAVPLPPAQPRRESVPGLMATRNTLKGIRSSTIPKGHPKRG